MDSWVPRAARLTPYTVPRCWVPHIYLPIYIYLGLRGPEQCHVELVDVAQLARVVEARLAAAVSK